MSSLIASLVFTGMMSSMAFSDLVCTKAPREAWMKTDEVKKKIELTGYKVKKFTTLEYCYKVDALDKAGKPVEMYFDPQKGVMVTPDKAPPIPPISQ